MWVTQYAPSGRLHLTNRFIVYCDPITLMKYTKCKHVINLYVILQLINLSQDTKHVPIQIFLKRNSL